MQTAANGRWEASIPCPPQWPTGDNRDTHRRGGGEWDSEPGSQPPEAPGVGLRLWDPVGKCVCTWLCVLGKDWCACTAGIRDSHFK